jgi:hypothetical protein
MRAGLMWPSARRSPRTTRALRTGSRRRARGHFRIEGGPHVRPRSRHRRRSSPPPVRRCPTRPCPGQDGRRHGPLFEEDARYLETHATGRNRVSGAQPVEYLAHLLSRVTAGVDGGRLGQGRGWRQAQTARSPRALLPCSAAAIAPEEKVLVRNAERSHHGPRSKSRPAMTAYSGSPWRNSWVPSSGSIHQIRRPVRSPGTALSSARITSFRNRRCSPCTSSRSRARSAAVTGPRPPPLSCPVTVPLKLRVRAPAWRTKSRANSAAIRSSSCVIAHGGRWHEFSGPSCSFPSLKLFLSGPYRRRGHGAR